MFFVFKAFYLGADMNVVELCLNADVAVAGVVGSERVLSTAALFGIDVAGDAVRTLFRDVRVTLGPGRTVLITGASGGGKTTMLRLIEKELRERGVRVCRLEEVAIEADRAVVDCFGGTLEEAMGHLARAGLAEAHLLIRRPSELSEGQKFRYRLAKFFASDAEVLIADEFTATLDRVTAKIVAYGLGKFVRKSGKCAVLATTHEDIAADVRADLHIVKGLGDVVNVE